MGIVEQPEAYFFDRAVGLFGVHLENELDKAGARGKNKKAKGMAQNMVLQKYLGAGQFATPGR